MTAALDLLAGLVIEDGRRWGEAATDAQWRAERSILDPASPPYHLVCRGQGYAKATDAAGTALAALFTAEPGSRLFVVGSDRDGGRSVLDAALGIIARSPALRGHVTASGATLTSSTGSTLDHVGAGGVHRPSMVVVYGLSQWQPTPAGREQWQAVASSVADRKSARLVVWTRGGSEDHWAHGVFTHAATDALWTVHHAAGVAPWSPEDRLDEQRRRLSPQEFRRTFEAAWTKSEGDGLTGVCGRCERQHVAVFDEMRRLVEQSAQVDGVPWQRCACACCGDLAAGQLAGLIAAELEVLRMDLLGDGDVRRPQAETFADIVGLAARLDASGRERVARVVWPLVDDGTPFELLVAELDGAEVEAVTT